MERTCIDRKKESEMKLKYYWPLIAFLVCVIFSGGLMWSHWAKEPVVIVGFTVMLFSMVVTYTMGIRIVLRESLHRSVRRIHHASDLRSFCTA